MKGRVCIVTGATSGIGRATAEALATRGATVGIVCRDRARGEQAIAEIRAATKNDALRLFIADLGSQAAVRKVADEILAAYPQIHVLVNNAGVVNLQYSETADGIETVFAVNHLAYFLLTLLLLDRLKASAPSRIVNVASHAHKFVKRIDFDDPGWKSNYKSMQVYGHSKLANILFTQELAQRLEGTGVTVNAVHPGAVATGLGKNNGGWAKVLIRVLAPFMRSPDNGAATSIYLATSDDVARKSGGYYAKSRQVKPSAAAQDSAAARRLWEMSERMVGSVPAAGGN